MFIGFKQLEGRYSLQLAQPLRVESSIGTARTRKESPAGLKLKFPPGYAPSDDFAGHFEFGLKYEEIHLEFLSRLFDACGPEVLQDWCLREPFGRYARRAGFLFEWLTGKRLDVPDLQNGSYVDVLPAGDYLTRTSPVKNRRWRVNDNLPGSPAFCPLVRRTSALQEALSFDPATALADLDQRYGGDLLLRSATWLTLKESRASFLIEHEEDQTDRIRRFANMLARHCGKLDRPLGTENLQRLQAEVLGDHAPGLGLRKSPVYVGQMSLQGDTVHYVAPHFEEIPGMLSGLEAFETATRGAEPLLRAGTLAFAFVYLHPLRDGNGRIHRFLINDTLLRDEAIPDGTILPLSAGIMEDRMLRADYERSLEAFSRPFLNRYGADCRFGEMTSGQDGTLTNFLFDAYEDARHAWRHPDLTAQALFVARLIRHTITNLMAQEAQLLLQFQRATERIKEMIELPDPDASRIIRSLREGGGRISGKLTREYPFLCDPSLAQRLVEAVQSAFEPGEDRIRKLRCSRPPCPGPV